MGVLLIKYLDYRKRTILVPVAPVHPSPSPSIPSTPVSLLVALRCVRPARLVIPHPISRLLNKPKIQVRALRSGRFSNVSCVIVVTCQF